MFRRELIWLNLANFFLLVFGLKIFFKLTFMGYNWFTNGLVSIVGILSMRYAAFGNDV